MNNTHQILLKDEQIHDILATTFRSLRANGYNGGMGGSTWDRASARAIERAVIAELGGMPAEEWLIEFYALLGDFDLSSLAVAQAPDPDKKKRLLETREQHRQELYAHAHTRILPDASDSKGAGTEELLIALGSAGVQVYGGTHGDPWQVRLPAASAAGAVPVEMGFGMVAVGTCVRSTDGVPGLVYLTGPGEARPHGTDCSDIYPVGSAMSQGSVLASIYFHTAAAVQQSIDVLCDLQRQYYAAPPAPSQQAEADAQDGLPAWWDAFIQNICDLPDRSSPDDEPDVLCATELELRGCAERAIEDHDAAPAAQGDERAALSRHSRAMLLNVLWHHQGGSSSVGQAIRAVLGIGGHDHLTDEQVSEAKWIDGLLARQQDGGDAEDARDGGLEDAAKLLEQRALMASQYKRGELTRCASDIRALKSAARAQRAAAQGEAV